MVLSILFALGTVLIYFSSFNFYRPPIYFPGEAVPMMPPASKNFRTRGILFGLGGSILVLLGIASIDPLLVVLFLPPIVAWVLGKKRATKNN